jgi:hypothetical protein
MFAVMKTFVTVISASTGRNGLKIRVGRVIGTTHIFLFGLITSIQFNELENIYTYQMRIALTNYLLFIENRYHKHMLMCNIVRPLVRPSVYPSVHTFVTDISASTGKNDFIFDIVNVILSSISICIYSKIILTFQKYSN